MCLQETFKLNFLNTKDYQSVMGGVYKLNDNIHRNLLFYDY